MRKLVFLIITTIALTSCTCHKTIAEANQKSDSQTGKEVVFIKLINDSRCPEGAQCIWAGEVTFEVAVYENGKILTQEQLTLNPTNQEEITTWFKNHLPESNKILKSVSITPYPKEGVSVKLEDYNFRLDY